MIAKPWLSDAIGRAWIYFAPQGPSARVFVAVYMTIAGLARVWTGNTAAGGVNMFASRAFGLLMMISGLALFLTVPSRYRYHWGGRIAAISAALLWLLLIAQAWGAWVSISGAAVFVIALINEVRVAAAEKRQNGDR